MSNPIWITPAGNLGTFTSQQKINTIRLQANPVYPASTVFYKIYYDNLPPGLTMSIIGEISGTPLYVSQTTDFGFTVQVYDDLGNTSLRDFYIKVLNPNPVWVTPSNYVLNGTTILNTGGYNNITWNLATIPLNQEITPIVLQANPVTPSTTLTYSIVSGSLPTGLVLTNDTESETATISGKPTDEVQSKTYTFVVRATDNLKYISDRTFTITVIGSLAPYFITESGALTSTVDSVWYEAKIDYINPAEDLYPSIISLASGSLPGGLEINEVGLIRGYPTAPVVQQKLSTVETTVTSTSNITKAFTCLSTANFQVGRQIYFTDSVFGGVSAYDPINPSTTTYYIKEIISNSEFTISQNINGNTVIPSSGSGLMTSILPATSVNQPLIVVYNFTLRLTSALGSQLRSYSIKVINQNAPTSIGGPNYLPNTRVPVIYNTRPFTYNIDQDVNNYGFYVLPPLSQITGETYSPNTYAPIGTFYSDNFFTFKILGYDFDQNQIEFVYDIPPEYNLTADPNTGWIRGYLNIAANTISELKFSAAARKKNTPTIISEFTNFEFLLTNNITDKIVWTTDSSLGNIYNGTTSIFKVEATSTNTLNYELVSGSLPNNLVLLDNGDIVGNVAFETTDDYALENAVIPYTFTVNAYDPAYKTIINSTKTFTLNVVQKFTQPTDSLYIQCTPSFKDRNIIDNLLSNGTLIPTSYLYRPDDQNFGKANNVTYVHAYGIYASNLQEYIEAVQINHYDRSITLGPLKTAIARNEKDEIVYEVVYSQIIDNLVNPQGISVSKHVVWDFFVDLNLGPWYTSITDIYTSYIYPVELDILTQNYLFFLTTQDNIALGTNQGTPTFYTSLTPGYQIDFYPNSLDNMRKQVEDTLAYDPSAELLPLWMSSQQANGSTLGFTPAWVIAYCKYEYAKDNQGNIILNADGTPRTYAQQIKYNIENNWVNEVGDKLQLNIINFQMDRFTVNKSMTYDYDNLFSPPAWTGLPSATPVPDPINSKNFNVLFPRKTILQTQTVVRK